MIYVIGCNHGIQQELIRDTQERAEQRSCFAKLVEETLRKGEIQFVCEEWSHEDGITIAQDIANKHGVRWLNINTSGEQLKQMGIPMLYTKLPIPSEWKARWHAERESFMLRKIKENRGHSKNLLVICGFDHMLPLSGSLREGDTEVKVIDYRKQNWYRRGVFG